MKRFKWYWLASFLPLLLSTGVGLYLNYASTRNPILYVRADLGTAFILCGAALTILLMLLLGIFETWDYAKRSQVDLLIQASEDHRRFMQRLDHELKNPLTAILAGLANLKEVNASDENKDVLQSVEDEVRRLSRLVSDLRKLSDLETRPLEKSKVNLTEVIDDALSLAKELPEADTREFIITVPRAPWPLAEISADRDLIFLALHNLLSNAVKFTTPGDTIEIRAFEDNQRITIEVADTGPGIPESEVPHVWEELYRGVGARGIPGSGLGLALVKSIITKHNGEINIRSRENLGTVVTVRLPIS